MILTVTPNPSVDRTLEIDHYVRGAVLRIHTSMAHAGGKGVNVSRALRSHGVQTVAVLPVGGAEGAQLTALLGEHGIAAVTVPVAAVTRCNITTAEADGTTTQLNIAGAALSEAEVAALLRAAESQLRHRPEWLVAGGSLPKGTPTDFYVRLSSLARRYGVPIAIDTSGAPLVEAVRAGAADLLKPNHHELAELLGRELTTLGDVVDATREVLSWGNGAALVTLGGCGALLVEPKRVWWAGGPPIVPRSTVGAGDSALAGYLLDGAEPEERLRRAVAWGSAAVALPGTTIPGPADVTLEGVVVVPEPDPSLPVADLPEVLGAGSERTPA
ncbi:1-phosphofructokinase [Thermobifida halotolerans]|uniref:1-phosphofructokinase n=1 Tax=Thermobifida halotolerans TaxID=483545 RepID=A0A399G2G6_9ACTN|nr:1-phosphofructokinase [Thermobifida halotolerans]UOE19777.1 1-phosphofructokinase [Thermobifida halotolerans]